MIYSGHREVSRVSDQEVYSYGPLMKPNKTISFPLHPISKIRLRRNFSMNMKKWSAGVMAAAMAFSLALPAGAAADPEAIQPLAYYDGTQDSPHKTVPAGD